MRFALSLKLPPRRALLRYAGGGFLVLAVIFLTLWLTGRTGIFEPFPREAVTIRVWTRDEDPAAFGELIRRYRDRHPNVTITVEHRAAADFEAALAAARENKVAPDLYQFADTFVPREQAHLAPAPGRVTSEDRVGREFLSGVGEAVIHEGKVYALPLSVQNLGLYYRKSLLAGVGIEPPATWSELVERVPKLTERSGTAVSRSGIALGTPQTDPSGLILATLMQQDGAVMVSDDKRTVRFTEPEQGSDYFPGPKALDFFTSFANPAKVTYSWTDSLGTPVEAFTAGKTAMLIAPSGLAPSLRAAVGDDLGVAPLPAIRTDRPRNMLAFTAYGVSRESRNIFVAWDFLKFATREKEQLVYHEQSGRLSPRKDLVREESRDAALAPFASQLTASHTWYAQGWPEAVTALHVAVTEVLQAKATPQQALQKAADTLNPVLQAAASQP